MVIVVFFFAMYEKQTDKTFTKMCAENDFFTFSFPVTFTSSSLFLRLRFKRKKKVKSTAYQ